jgi:hypothetical protein
MAAIAITAAIGMPKNSSRKTRSNATPAGSGTANGLRSDGSIPMVGSRAARTVVTTAHATIAQTTGRHRGEGGWPSGNSTGSSSSTQDSGHPGQVAHPTDQPKARDGAGRAHPVGGQFLRHLLHAD